MEPQPSDSVITAIERPHPNLMVYYVFKSFRLGPLFFLWLPYLFFRYHTLRYRFDHEGIAMRWGVLFRREIHLTYARIQDIHLTSGIIERYLGLARIHIQTASGRASAEMVIEGLLESEEVRDFLYSRMRGLKGSLGTQPPDAAGAPGAHPSRSGMPSSQNQAAAALFAAAAELRSIRELLAARGNAEPNSSG
jgi:putative membrane protein